MASSSLLTSLLILSASLSILAPSCFADYVLFAGGHLSGGQSLQYGNYIFTMQTDCNLVLYDAGQAIWQSGTYNKGSSCNLQMQTDGNLVIYDGSNNAIWNSGTSRGQGHFVLVLQPDRNVVIYGGSVWQTATNHVSTSAISANQTNSVVVVAGENIAMVTGE